MWKTCELGHKFLVCLDASPEFDRVACVDGSDYAHPMEARQKKPRVGPSRTECMSQADKVRHIMGLVAPRDTRKARPQMLHVPAPPTVASSPPLSVALASLVAAPVPEDSPMRPVQSSQHKKYRRDTRDEDDEDVDIDAALRTMDDIAAENAAAEFACGTD